jgi:hypothetical protein
LNLLPLATALGAPTLGGVLVAGVWYYGSPRYTDVGYRPVQPVPYSHALHAGELGLDCRYCHVSVETAAVANLPPTATCMNCHTLIKRDSQSLAPIRASQQNGKPMRWVRVHNVPDYAYFHHAVHVRAGVGCASCHGAIHRMEVVQQVEPLSMGWCLDCHRNPAPHLRPQDQVTNMDWQPSKELPTHEEMVARGIAPPVDCSGCHR